MTRQDMVGAVPRAAPAVPPDREENPLVRAIGRAPLGVRAKLLVALAGIAILLISVAGLGLRVIERSNARIETLGTLQLRAATYQDLQTQAHQLRQLLGLRSAADPNVTAYLGGKAADAPGGRQWILVDEAIAASLAQLGPATNETRFEFVPPSEDEAILERIRHDYRRFTQALAQIISFDEAGTTSKGQPSLSATVAIDNDLGALADTLATTTRAEASALIAENGAAYSDSRDLFIGVGAASILLAILLGIVLSRSLVGPIQVTEARLAEIASGDFSRHVDVRNRDELGSLAVNLNRMNDELRRLYEELETVSRHKSEFLANMSHELRTPLNAIIGFSELLHERLAGDLNAQQLGYVEDVLEAGRHLLALINDILDLSKIEAGRMELDLSEFSLRDTLERGVKMHKEVANRAGIDLELRLDFDDIVMRADERKLRQVVVNLLSNAVKFTPPGGRVEVSAGASSRAVDVAVADTGPGIAQEDRELIFEEFGQARSERADRHDGTGLGLALSRRFIELQGGRLWVESVEGEGSTFRFTLPVEQSG